MRGRALRRRRGGLLDLVLLCSYGVLVGLVRQGDGEEGREEGRRTRRGRG